MADSKKNLRGFLTAPAPAWASPGLTMVFTERAWKANGDPNGPEYGPHLVFGSLDESGIGTRGVAFFRLFNIYKNAIMQFRTIEKFRETKSGIAYLICGADRGIRKPWNTLGVFMGAVGDMTFHFALYPQDFQTMVDLNFVNLVE